MLIPAREVCKLLRITPLQLYKKVLSGLCPYDEYGYPLLFMENPLLRAFEITSYLIPYIDKKICKLPETGEHPVFKFIHAYDKISFIVFRDIYNKALKIEYDEMSFVFFAGPFIEKYRVEYCSKCFYIKNEATVDVQSLMEKIFTSESIASTLDLGQQIPTSSLIGKREYASQPTIHSQIPHTPETQQPATEKNYDEQHGKDATSAPLTPETYVQKFRKQGVVDAHELAALVDQQFSGEFHLSDAKLGMLLPARPGTAVSYNTKRDRGRRLRGKK